MPSWNYLLILKPEFSTPADHKVRTTVHILLFPARFIFIFFWGCLGDPRGGWGGGRLLIRPYNLLFQSCMIPSTNSSYRSYYKDNIVLHVLVLVWVPSEDQFKRRSVGILCTCWDYPTLTLLKEPVISLESLVLSGKWTCRNTCSQVF